ncbi:MAG: elongation factor P [Dehalococcoidia bacterium]|nr:elongation factor P [Dehalococcoidia bacterium]
MINLSEMRKGLMVEYEGQIYQVVESSPFRHAQRAAMVKIKLKNIRTNKNVERTMQGSEKLRQVSLERRLVQYLYREGDLCYFMDTSNFEQIPMNVSQIEEEIGYLKEGITLNMFNYKGEPVYLELPITVDLKIVETGPAFKGDTAASGGKQAKLETGLEIKVPLFIAQDDVIRLDTRTGEYLERVS